MTPKGPTYAGQQQRSDAATHHRIAAGIGDAETFLAGLTRPAGNATAVSNINKIYFLSICKHFSPLLITGAMLAMKNLLCLLTK